MHQFQKNLMQDLRFSWRWLWRLQSSVTTVCHIPKDSNLKFNFTFCSVWMSIFCSCLLLNYAFQHFICLCYL
jgi:hypothetical protein